MMRDTAQPTRSFVDVRSLVFWVGGVLAVYGAIHIYPTVIGAAQQAPQAAVVSAILWAAYGLVFALIVYRMELFERRSALTSLGAFLWGAVIVAGIGVTASPAMSDIVGGIIGTDSEWIPAIAAPLSEEPLKMLGIIALAFIPGARIRTPLDGMYYGLLVGLGFEVTESFLFATQAGISMGGTVAPVVASFVLRGIVGGLWNHPTFSAITGAGVGYFFSGVGSLAKRWAVMIGTLIAAMFFHGLFDSPLLEADGNVLVATLVKGLPAFVLLVVMFRMARNRERAIFAAAVDRDIPSDLITPEEGDTLLTKKARRRAARAVRKASGFAAGHAAKRLQRRQIELVSSIVDAGAESDEVAGASEEVREARATLATVVADR